MIEKSQRCTELHRQLSEFMDEHIYPNETPIKKEISTGERWQPTEIVEGLKIKAREAGLWNLFLPESELGAGLSNYDYAPLCEVMGRSPYAPEVFNCSAPDTGNMEVLSRYGTPEQQKEWLVPLLAGEIRSAFAMTEPDVASSDATNIQSQICRDGDDYVVNGHKWWTSGANDPRCKILIFMGKTDPDNEDRYRQQSMILIPMLAPGVKVLRHLPVLGFDDAPHGHAEVLFENVRVPASNMLLGEGRGFEIAQGRLGPGRIHHCMRSIGQAEKALELMVKRAGAREAFGKKLIKLGKNLEVISRARIEIDACRLMVLQAAKAMDVLGNKEARIYVSAVKAMVPEKVCNIIDQAMQIHGAAGISHWSPLPDMWHHQRHLRFADGPDEVHHMVVGRAEAQKHVAW